MLTVLAKVAGTHGGGSPRPTDVQDMESRILDANVGAIRF